ncbi:hypothetical protein [Microscilla marina]|uniref:Uncharacterized protein n=1 Tax=Microscilla marina ATCC 23134 TaxID=313606 RepID=A1ZH37_MICM2|nr:hypothetical protein [Microscilla marina]EAY30306.1 hypothetical protein M23134_08130 [Microscilla marina ATCC 23134]
MPSEQVFKRKAFSYISKFFVVVAFTFSLSVDLNYGSRELFPGYNIVMFAMIILALIMGIWEATTPLVTLQGNQLSVNLTLFTGKKTIDLTKAVDVSINPRQTLMTLSDEEDTTLRIPLSLIQGAANRDNLIDIVKEKLEV